MKDIKLLIDDNNNATNKTVQNHKNINTQKTTVKVLQINNQLSKAFQRNLCVQKHIGKENHDKKYYE